jgi:hypothetical protein
VFGSATKHSIRVQYIDGKGHEWDEDGLALAEAAFETWEAFLRDKVLPPS